MTIEKLLIVALSFFLAFGGRAAFAQDPASGAAPRLSDFVAKGGMVVEFTKGMQLSSKEPFQGVTWSGALDGFDFNTPYVRRAENLGPLTIESGRKAVVVGGWRNTLALVGSMGKTASYNYVKLRFLDREANAPDANVELVIKSGPKEDIQLPFLKEPDQIQLAQLAKALSLADSKEGVVSSFAETDRLPLREQHSFLFEADEGPRNGTARILGIRSSHKPKTGWTLPEREINSVTFSVAEASSARFHSNSRSMKGFYDEHFIESKFTVWFDSQDQANFFVNFLKTSAGDYDIKVSSNSFFAPHYRFYGTSDMRIESANSLTLVDKKSGKQMSLAQIMKTYSESRAREAQLRDGDYGIHQIQKFLDWKNGSGTFSNGKNRSVSVNSIKGTYSGPSSESSAEATFNSAITAQTAGP